MEDVSLACVSASPALALYRIQPSPIEAFIASTPETRSICNDPTVAGVRYTDLLRKACTEVLRALPNDLQEAETVVVNILRGGLNFGLRDALAAAYNWNAHTTSFISAQRARDERDTDAWHITENAYRKVYLPPRASFVIGDVVATGTSLRYGLQELVLAAREQKIDVRSILFFTYGGPQSENILSEIDARCRELFPGYEKTTLIYLEGRFAVAASDTPLHVRLTGTDLLRLGSLMAPEFIESQYENPAYPLERCIIYDAGSRAFWLYEYVEDVIGYWKQNLQFAEQGMTFTELLRERFPQIDPARFGDVDLKQLCLARLADMEKVIGPHT